MLAVPPWFENTVIGNDALDVSGARPDSLADLPHFRMPATAGSNVFNFAVGLVELAESQPAFGGSDVQQIMGIKRTLPAANLFHRCQLKGKNRYANGVFTPYGSCRSSGAEKTKTTNRLA